VGYVQDREGAPWHWVNDDEQELAVYPADTDPDGMAPALIDLSLGELHARPGRAIRELASGAVVRLRDDRAALGDGQVGFLILARELPPQLRQCQHLIPPCPGDEKAAE
jgi:hypothetical protein